MLCHVCAAAALVAGLATTPARADARAAMLPADRFLHASVGVVGGLGFAPRTNAGVTAMIGYRTDRYALDIEGRYDFAATAGASTSSLLSFAFIPCMLRGPFAVCAIAAAGARRSMFSSRFWTAVGARIAVDIPIVSTLTIGAHLDGVVPLFRPVLGDGWKPSPVGAALGLRIGMSFE